MFRQSKPSVKKDKGTKPKQSRPREKSYNIPDGQTRSYDPEASAKKEAELTEQVRSFSEDGARDRLTFPLSLNSHDRLVVHQVAEKLGLYHTSTGENRGRQITISKQPIRADSAEPSTRNAEGENSVDANSKEEKPSELDVDATIDELRTENPMEALGAASRDGAEVVSHDAEGNFGNDSAEVLNDRGRRTNCHQEPEDVAAIPSRKPQVKSDSTPAEQAQEFYKCQFCKKKLPAGSVFLHEIHCEKATEEKRRLREAPRTKKKMDKSKQRHALETTAEEDFDKLIAVAMETDTRCNFVRCKEKIALTGVLCTFCNRRYCFGHNMPEVHGCGEMARAQARKMAHKEKAVRNGTGIRERKVDPTHRAQLERKLGKKRGEMEEKRMRKSSQKK